ncbi:hypothetical protein ACWGNQ_22475, partial [[Kitasatospora] papulosa]
MPGPSPASPARRTWRRCWTRRSSPRRRACARAWAAGRVKEVLPADRGILLGTLDPGRAEVRASWEDVIVAIMAPRSGKTSGLAIPAILSAPGPVLLTSNKAANDAFTTTVDARAEVGTIWTLDPQQIAHHPREMWWD